MSVARIELNTNYTKSGDREVADCFGVQDKGRYLNIFFKSHQMRRFLYQMKEEKNADYNNAFLYLLVQYFRSCGISNTHFWMYAV